MLVPAFGRGERLGADKLWLEVEGRPLVAFALEAAGVAGCFHRLVIAAPEGRWAELRDIAAAAGFHDVDLVAGGRRRQDSVASALRRAPDAEIVCVHDGARPLVPPHLFNDVVVAAAAHRAATTAVPCVDTVKRVAEGYVVETLERDSLVATQTPQAFERALLEAAHADAESSGVDASDDALLVERLGVRVAVVAGDVRNFKVTHPHDLEVMKALLRP
ncbi:MAG TPA: 2-C-methyl-D-erythritol 4-phosphate cytidylyltransferase [Dehalococcoidia bacterium]|nr:2-C-methyl-D-erythritol 4-phosphate cytidylyltransferase [Dehalococcoidia bacterium]